MNFLAETNVLVCLLPLTSETKNILNNHIFEQLPKDAYMINVARGAHLDEDDLLKMIDRASFGGDWMFSGRNHCPEQHPFWNNKKIKVSPHIASTTNIESVIPQILKNFRLMQEGKDLENEVDREKEY